MESMVSMDVAVSMDSVESLESMDSMSVAVSKDSMDSMDSLGCMDSINVAVSVDSIGSIDSMHVAVSMACNGFYKCSGIHGSYGIHGFNGVYGKELPIYSDRPLTHEGGPADIWATEAFLWAWLAAVLGLLLGLVGAGLAPPLQGLDLDFCFDPEL